MKVSYSFFYNTARRFTNMEPAELLPTTNPSHPILLDGGWLQPPKHEVINPINDLN